MGNSVFFHNSSIFGGVSSCTRIGFKWNYLSKFRRALPPTLLLLCLLLQPVPRTSVPVLAFAVLLLKEEIRK